MYHNPIVYDDDNNIMLLSYIMSTILEPFLDSERDGSSALIPEEPVRNSGAYPVAHIHDKRR